MRYTKSPGPAPGLFFARRVRQKSATASLVDVPYTALADTRSVKTSNRRNTHPLWQTGAERSEARGMALQNR
jgi:hypothetical protein